MKAEQAKGRTQPGDETKSLAVGQRVRVTLPPGRYSREYRAQCNERVGTVTRVCRETLPDYCHVRLDAVGGKKATEMLILLSELAIVAG